MNVYGVEAIVRIVSHLAFIYLAFWALQSLKIETLFKQHREIQVRMLYVFVAIVIGFTTSSFFLEIMALVKNFFIGLA